MNRSIPLWDRIRTRNAASNAFTRLELLVLLIVMALVAVVGIPVLAQGKPRAEQSICFNNLRLIGQALLMFGAEHGQVDPWRLPSSGTGLENNVWYNVAVLSNELQTPKILVCPSDTRKKMAKDFSVSFDGGFVHPTYQNNAVSYFLGLDSFFSLPQSVLSGDRNVKVFGAGGCSSGLNPAWGVDFPPFSPTSWTPGLHGTSGNLLFHDGRVEPVSNDGLNRAFSSFGEDNGSTHLLLPSHPFL